MKGNPSTTNPQLLQNISLSCNMVVETSLHLQHISTFTHHVDSVCETLK